MQCQKFQKIAAPLGDNPNLPGDAQRIKLFSVGVRSAVN